MKDVVNKLVKLSTITVMIISKLIEEYNLATPFSGLVLIIGTNLNLFNAPINSNKLTEINLISNIIPYVVEKIFLISPRSM